MVSDAFCKRFPEALTGEIFEHILYKAFNNRMIDLSTIFIDALISKPVQSRKSSGRNRSQKREGVFRAAAQRGQRGKREAGQEAHYDDKDNDRPD